MGRAKFFILFFIILTATTGITAALWPRQSESEGAAGATGMVHMDLGFTYISLTPGMAEQYRVDVDHGAMVTDVVPDGPAGTGGLLPGDIILRFNGEATGETRPLLGMMMDCPENEPMSLDILRDGQEQRLNLYGN